jgi:predicted nucleic-acid-binding Zn-ribbon protein
VPAVRYNACVKGSHTCPKCRHRKIWIVPTVELAREIKRVLDITTLARLRIGGSREITARDPVQGFETYVCASCGFTEHYAVAWDDIERVGTLIDGDAGPYR